MPLDDASWSQPRRPGRRVQIDLPVLHEDQRRAYEVIKNNRYVAIRCGRRWGKTTLAVALMCDAAIRGEFVGLFAPEFKYLADPYRDVVDILAPVILHKSQTEGILRTITGGRIDFWSLSNDRAGRSRRYHMVVMDEAAFTKPNMLDVWNKAIKPTLLDYRGSAIAASNTNGVSDDNFFYYICQNKDKSGFVEFHAPSRGNPYMPVDELDLLKESTHPLVFRQEYEALFVDFSGEALFALDYLLGPDHRPVPPPVVVDTIFCVIDTAVKDRSEHDGTACVWFARSRHVGTPLTVLDWEIIQIEGSLLEQWLPSVATRGEELARQCRARFGYSGAWIEDKVSGTILLQQAQRRGMQARPIESRLTEVGKDARALSVSGYVYRGMVKISPEAYDKQMVFKDIHRNHLLSQVTGFRLGVDHGPDDLADCFMYGAAIALGDARGF